MIEFNSISKRYHDDVALNDINLKVNAREGDGEELASMYAAGALGLFDQVTPDFKTITGHAPESMLDFLSRSYVERE